MSDNEEMKHDEEWRYRIELQPDIILDGDYSCACVKKERDEYWRKILDA